MVDMSGSVFFVRLPLFIKREYYYLCKSSEKIAELE